MYGAVVEMVSSDKVESKKYEYHEVKENKNSKK